MPDEALIALLNDPNNWKQAAVPKPDKAFGATAPVMQALRDLYRGSDVSKGLTDFARRAYNNTYTRGIIDEMEATGGELGLSGPGRYIKDSKDALNALRASGRQGADVADEMLNHTIEKLFPVFFGQ